MRVITFGLRQTNAVFILSYKIANMAILGESAEERRVGEVSDGRLLAEREIESGVGVCGTVKPAHRPPRSVKINLAESPLGWLFAHGHLSQRQFDAGERLRADWERAQLPPRITMAWGSAPVSRDRGGAAALPDFTAAQIDAKRRFNHAVASAGPGLADILWRVVCAGEGMREAESALGWPARAGKLVLTFALDRVADYYRIR